MENQHRQIKGYRELSEQEIALMNEVKSLGEDLGNMIATLKQMPEIDQRWVSIAHTDLQKGIMALVRSIAQPTSF
ncbi:MAG: hypothetical protein E6Q97_19660 [Desulfurellales bacterium]|nr:MAG: hypothetical protein E6Q97_19660 [Desulfurellales bacterium]